MRNSDFNTDPFNRYLGLTLEETAADSARIRLTMSDATPQGIGGGAHGGALATLVDMAAVTAVFTDIPKGTQPAGTADLQISYLRPARGAWLDGQARVVKRGRQLCTALVDIRNDDGVLVATGRVLYALRTG